MRSCGLALAVVSGLVIGPAAAQAPDILFSGTARPIAGMVSGAWCALEAGPALFQRTGAKQVLITLPPLYYAQTTPSGGSYYLLAGQARMSFSNSAKGTLSFVHPKSYPSDVLSPAFAQYTEDYSAAKGTLAVRFRLTFPNCAIVVVGNFRG